MEGVRTDRRCAYAARKRICKKCAGQHKRESSKSIGAKSESKRNTEQHTPGALLVIVWRRGRGLGGPLGRRLLLRHFPHAPEVAAAARVVEAHVPTGREPVLQTNGRRRQCQ